jgi:hypothetical protein
VQGASLGEEAVLADSGRVGEVAVRVGRVRREAFSTPSFSATSHIVDERTVDVGATEADGIKEDIVIRHKVPVVG